MSRLLIIFFLGGPASAHADAPSDYAAQCAVCHGAAGNGDGPAASSMSPKPANFQDSAFWSTRTDAQIKTVIKSGGLAVGKSPLMPPASDWTDNRIGAMVAYLKTFKETQ